MYTIYYYQRITIFCLLYMLLRNIPDFFTYTNDVLENDKFSYQIQAFLYGSTYTFHIYIFRLFILNNIYHNPVLKYIKCLFKQVI